eukprot:1196317-Prorocentrum_minimum.AAC.7
MSIHGSSAGLDDLITAGSVEFDVGARSMLRGNDTGRSDDGGRHAATRVDLGMIDVRDVPKEKRPPRIMDTWTHGDIFAIVSHKL